MAVTRSITDIFNGPASSGDIISPIRDLGTGDGIPAALPAWLNNGIYGCDSGSSTTAYSGYRFTTGGIDLSTRSLIGWQMAHNDLPTYNLDTFANGGMRVVFDDGTNWASYAMFGGEFGPFLSASEGAFGSFTGLAANNQSVTPCWFLDRDNRTPYASSGTLNWSSITHIEVHFKPASSSRLQVVMGRIVTVGLSVFTGTTGNTLWVDMRNDHTNPGGGYYIYPWLFRPSPAFTRSTFQKLETIQVGVQIGDGATTTTLSESNFSLSGWGRPEDHIASQFTPPNACILIDTPRLLDIFQSSTDNVSLTDWQYSSQSMIGFRVRGSTSGTANFIRGTLSNFNQMELGHGSYSDGIWQDGLVPVEVTADTSIIGGSVRNSYGIELTGIAGDYSALTISLNDNNVSDVKVGEGGAGAYTLTGLSSDGTLKIWNSSTANAVTVNLTPGTLSQVIDLWFDYNNELSGPFTEGETLTFGNGATAQLVSLIDNGTTGTMYCELLTGTPPPDTNTITGATSSATANVNQVGGANNSSLTISSDLLVTLRVTALDASTGSPIEDARVRLVADTGGPETSGTVLLQGLTGPTGVLETTYTYTSEQPVTGTVRKYDAPPYYEPSNLTGSITVNGYNVPINMILD